MASDILFQRFSGQPVISYLFLEIFQRAVAANESITMRDALLPALEAVGISDPSDEVLEAYGEAIHTLFERKGDAEVKRRSNKREFGSEFFKWAEELELDDRLFLISGYDYERAYSYYVNTPIPVVERLWSLFVMQEWQRIQGGYEGVVYGMGGELKASSAKVHEAPKTEMDLEQRRLAAKSIGL